MRIGRRAAIALAATLLLGGAGRDGQAAPWPRHDPSGHALVVLGCSVHMEDQSISGGLGHALSRGLFSKFSNLDAYAYLLPAEGKQALIAPQRVGKALVFADLAPGAYVLKAIQADVGSFAPPEAFARSPGTRFLYTYTLRSNDTPGALSFTARAGEIVYLGEVGVEGEYEPRFHDDGRVRSWQNDQPSYRLERSASDERKLLHELLRKSKKSPWRQVIEARIAALTDGTPQDSTTVEWK
jgi:hypothetical protein